MINLITKIANSLENDYHEKQWVKLSLKCLCMIIIGVCMGLLLGKLAFLILDNIEEIVVTIGAIACFFMILFSFIKSPPPPPPPPPPIPQEFDPITLESTYNMLRKNLCSVIGDIADIIKLRKPANLRQMDGPTHYDIVANAVIYHYLILKQSDGIDAFSVIGILQNAIEQRLNNNEVEGITQTAFFYNGQVYPSIMVDNVQDLGNYVQIDIAIASEYYCKYRERRIYNNMNQTGIIKPKDKDF